MSSSFSKQKLKVGFIPVSDCAPLVIAHELGIFAKHGLSVELCREVGWANIRDKVAYGQLQAAHAVAPLPFAIEMGWGTHPVRCITGLILNAQGNAITLSSELRDRGIRTASQLHDEIRRTWGKRSYTFGVVFPFSAQHFMLRGWLRGGGIDPDQHVRIVVIPPAQMFPNLRLGNIDGYCVGEPWTSVAVEAGLGCCVATSSQMMPLHPEKVLMVREDFAQSRHEEHIRLIGAVLEACRFCDNPENSKLICDLLSESRYVNAPTACVAVNFQGLISHPHDSTGALDHPLTLFHRFQVNEPSAHKARWVMDQLAHLSPSNRTQIESRLDLHQLFRVDLYDEANIYLRTRLTPHENHTT